MSTEKKKASVLDRLKKCFSTKVDAQKYRDLEAQLQKVTEEKEAIQANLDEANEIINQVDVIIREELKD